MREWARFTAINREPSDVNRWHLGGGSAGIQLQAEVEGLGRLDRAVVEEAIGGEVPEVFAVFGIRAVFELDLGADPAGQ